MRPRATARRNGLVTGMVRVTAPGTVTVTVSKIIVHHQVISDYGQARARAGPPGPGNPGKSDSVDDRQAPSLESRRVLVRGTVCRTAFPSRSQLGLNRTV
jgi:hypothetical protein